MSTSEGTVSSLTQAVEAANTNDPQQQKVGVVFIKNLLSAGMHIGTSACDVPPERDAPIEEVINTGVVARLISLLDPDLPDHELLVSDGCG